MKKILTAALLPLLSAILLTSCAGPTEDEPSVVPVSEPETVTPPAQMETEDELREGLAALGDAADTRAEKIEFYEELLARDLFQSEDYLELAQLYADSGDTDAQHRMLWRGFRLYPGEEYVRRLQELVVEYTDADAAAAILTDTLQPALTEQNAAALRALIKDESWGKAFQEAPEIYATRTRYTAGDISMQIVSDSFETEVLILSSGGTCLYGRVNDAGSLIASASFTDGAYNGSADVCWFDAEDVLYKRYQTTLRDNICVDSVSIEYDGISYAGALGEDGAVLEEQQEKITAAGGVVYAYQQGGSRYLYQENAALDTFRLDHAAIGLPDIEIWE